MAHTDRHTDITLSILMVGHTKFSPDWCFGLCKRLYKRIKVSSLKHCKGDKRISWVQLCLVGFAWRWQYNCSYIWLDKLLCATHPGIKRIHHFRVSSSQPCFIFTKEHSDTVEVKFNMLKQPWSPNKDELPPPRRASVVSVWTDRPFCSNEDKDTTCPIQIVPKPGQSSPALEAVEDWGFLSYEPVKRV